ncbi:hypothetical protein AAVH_41830 [Aphelenchoides avenae]|nr:hypothetical protein AAVH_41830 [Aphelenchus avenae]
MNCIVRVAVLLILLLPAALGQGNEKHNGCEYVPGPKVQCNQPDGPTKCADYCRSENNKQGQCVTFEEMWAVCEIPAQGLPPHNRFCLCYNA